MNNGSNCRHHADSSLELNVSAEPDLVNETFDQSLEVQDDVDVSRQASIRPLLNVNCGTAVIDDGRLSRLRDSYLSSGDYKSQLSSVTGESPLDISRKPIRCKSGFQQCNIPREGIDSYHRFQLNLSHGAATMKVVNGNVVYKEMKGSPQSPSSFYDDLTVIRQERSQKDPANSDGVITEDNADANSNIGPGIDILHTNARPEDATTTECSDANIVTVGGDSVERKLVDDIHNKFIAQLDLRITDYFVHVRCMCNYTVYTLHFNDFGIHKVATRRFSEFYFYDQVLRLANYQTPIPLPPKRFWNNTAPAFLSQRFQGLRNYFMQQVNHSTNTHLYLLHMFLGCSMESILYLRLVTAPTVVEKMNAVNVLFMYLMQSPDTKVKYLSEVVTPPLTSFKHLSAAKTEVCDVDHLAADYRLASALVMESLLDCLVSGNHKTVAEVCAIFLYMLHHEDDIRKCVLTVKTVIYTTKAIMRLILRKSMFDFEFPFSHFRYPLNGGTLDMAAHGNQSAWTVASYFLVLALNLMPDAARSYLADRSALDKLGNLLELNDYDVLKRFAAWLLWIASFQHDLKSIVDADAVTSLLKKLYGSEDTSIKVMCGLAIVSLIAAGWFDKESEPRALASVIKLLDCLYDVDVFISQQIFSHWTITRFSDLLANKALSTGARLYLVSVLKHHLTLDFETVKDELSLSKIYDTDYPNLSQVNHVLFGAADPDYRSDIDPKSDITFNEKFASLYFHKFRHISIAMSEILYDIGNSTWGDQVTTPKEDDTFDDITHLSYNTAMCLLLLPYDSPNKIEGDYFDVDFNLQSKMTNFRNVVHLKGENLKLQMDTVDQINLEDTVVVRLDKLFFTRRMATLSVLLSRLQESLVEFNDVHLSNNEITTECMTWLRRCWSSKDLIERSDSPNVVVNFEACSNERIDLFNNFEFPGIQSPVFDFYSGFKSVDTFEMCQYVNHMLKFNSVQQRLLKLIKVSILYHQACDARISMYKSMITLLETRVNDIRIDILDDLVDMEERFLVDSSAYHMGLQTEGEIVSKLNEKNILLSRVENMLKSTKSKLEACRRQVSSIQRRIDDIPRLRNDSMASKNQLDQLIKGLEDSIRAGNESILELQVKVAQDERLKQDYSDRINQITHFSSAVESAQMNVIIKALDEISSDELRLEIQQHLNSITSVQMDSVELDIDTVFRLKSAVLNHINSVHEKLNLLYSSDNNRQIAALNRKVQQDEERLYRAQVELQSTNKTLAVDDKVLQDALASHKLMLSNIESTSNNLKMEISKINEINRELDQQLSNVKANNHVARTRLEKTRSQFIEGIKAQRAIRLESLWQLLAAEFMCKKLLQERTKLSLVLAQKTKLADTLKACSDEEKATRSGLIESLKVASQRLKETARFLEGSPVSNSTVL